MISMKLYILTIIAFVLVTPTFAQKAGDGNGHSTVLSVFPNPFAAVAKFRVTFPETADVSIRLLDDLGKEVMIVANEANVKGERIFTVKSNLTAGHYICEMHSAKFGILERMSVIRTK